MGGPGQARGSFVALALSTPGWGHLCKGAPHKHVETKPKAYLFSRISLLRPASPLPGPPTLQLPAGQAGP